MKEKLNNYKEALVKFYKENKNTCIVFIAIFLVLIVLLIVSLNRTKYGNTSINLNNLGFSVEKGNYIYYLGLKDNNSDGIYRISKSGNKSEKISSDYGIYLNKSGNYIYFLDMKLNEYNISRIKANGKDKTDIINNVDGERITVVDNWIYYFKDTKFYRARINGEDKQILSDKQISNYEIIGNTIYYSYRDDDKTVISKMKTNGENKTKITNDASEQFFVVNGKIYYIYNRYDEKEYRYVYELYKINTNGKNNELIEEINENIDTGSIVIIKNKMYYLKENDDYSYSIYSKKIRKDDEQKIVDLQGSNSIMNIQDGWIYYTDEKDNGDSQMFKVKTNGNSKIELSV